ncbi:MAG: universal stress protein [Thermodesulfovibrionales bacterium]|nr:universal stress protein [Thermodesulfovibrionales bacterium]
MKKILIAVDDTKGSKSAVPMCSDICRCVSPEAVVIVYVEKFEGRSLIDEMLGDAEMATLRDALEGTEYKARLDEKADKIVSFFKKRLEGAGVANIKTVIRSGHPAEEILKTAKKEKVDMILVGSRGKRVGKLFMGSVSREVANNAEVPVLIMK